MQIRSFKCATAVHAAVLVAVFAAGCGKKPVPISRPPVPPPTSGAETGAGADATMPAPPQPVNEPTIVPPEPGITSDNIGSRSLDELNRDSPLQPLFFEFDSAEISPRGQAVLDANAELLKRYGTWVITVEGHCDERGTPEYNLALGERRAVAARTYLVSLGVPPDRLRVVSYGKEFPFDPGHSEAAWAKNRRAHFVITAK
jgi:peptidoglycan-associated lipoprotein